MFLGSEAERLFVVTWDRFSARSSPNASLNCGVNGLRLPPSPTRRASQRRLQLEGSSLLALWTEIGMAIAAAIIRPTSTGVENSNSPIGFWPRSTELPRQAAVVGWPREGAVPCVQHRQTAEASFEVTRYTPPLTPSNTKRPSPVRHGSHRLVARDALHGDGVRGTRLTRRIDNLGAEPPRRVEGYVEQQTRGCCRRGHGLVGRCGPRELTGRKDPVDTSGDNDRPTEKTAAPMSPVLCPNVKAFPQDTVDSAGAFSPPCRSSETNSSGSHPDKLAKSRRVAHSAKEQSSSREQYPLVPSRPSGNRCGGILPEIAGSRKRATPGVPFPGVPLSRQAGLFMAW